jgi:hypothetical protein
MRMARPAVTAVVSALAPLCGVVDYPHWRAVKLHLLHTVERMRASRNVRRRTVKTKPLTIVDATRRFSWPDLSGARLEH